MDNLAVNLPQIISAAAQSYLGILALLSIALSVLAYFFFSNSSEKVKVGIFTLLFFGVVGFGVVMLWVSNPEQNDNSGKEPRTDDSLLALRMVNIDFSVGETILKEWLNNSSTLYPAISVELLNLLRGKRLTQPVYLDVIVYNYEQATGSSSPSGTNTIDLTRLKTAVIKSYNTRYGVAVTDFSKLLVTGSSQHQPMAH